MPLGIDSRIISQCQGDSFDNDIVDADLDPILFFVGIEFCSHFDESIHLDGRTYVVMRDFLFGL